MSDSRASLLSITQREEVANENDKLDVNITRFRSRIIRGFHDLALLENELSEESREELFSEGFGEDLNRANAPKSLEDANKFYQSLVSAVAFIYQGLSDRGFSTDNIEKFFERSIRQAERDSIGFTGEAFEYVTVDVQIDIDREPSAKMVYERFKDGEPLTNEEIGLMVRQGYIDSDDLSEIQQREPA